ncbi:HD-GYP domain-containing protein [Halanaerobium sp. Z-7514]|uniref:HD-GYP domain-containing protein n=1 Tax=Halanaerobium polyolivorans TaxID=2886943 RepID=A0AAW4WWQ4_9FIRM|nr:HD-GYP domain-containing protein [Halanaerobium polyolivorans]MCC3145160.1 HD-GYP domain-containing protein [Halanaerobium polyolivorans]RQD74050.1 MAG: HD-GYP domain-containing protein [Halanaerobium sp. MSAO_Bac5]
MRLVLTEDLTQEMKLAKAIYDNDNILLNKGVKNLHQYKDRLLELGIDYLYVEDKYSADIELKPVIKEKSRRQGKKVIKKTLDKISEGLSQNDIKELKGLVDEISSQIILNDEVLLNLHSLKRTSEYTYEHSLNVGVISIAIAKILGYSRNDICKIGMGGMLHDTGKKLIPEKILKKPARLTDSEYDIMKNHPQLGFEELQKLETISPLSRTMVFSHHERWDGTGYPRGLKGEETHVFARIAAIADVFDALSSSRVYRDKMPVHKALEYIMHHTETLFDYQIVKKILPKISFYPNGSEVILSTGERGIVKAQNRGFPTRPIIRIIQSSTGKEKDAELDLLKHMNIVIEEVIA